MQNEMTINGTEIKANEMNDGVSEYVGAEEAAEFKATLRAQFETINLNALAV